MSAQESLNSAIADIFDEMGQILELQGENVFKIRAYYKAALVLRDLSEDIAEIAKADRLNELPGIGTELSKKIVEFIQTGKMSAYEKLKSQVPEGLLELLEISGLGPKTVAKLNKILSINNIDDLKKAIENGSLATVPGIREKTIENIKRGIELFYMRRKRILLGEALPLAEDIINAIKKIKGVRHTDSAGSLRRMKETIGDVDILAIADNGLEVVRAFSELPFVHTVLDVGETKGSILLKNGLQVDLRVLNEDEYGSALLYFTGSKEHNIHLRTLAKDRGLKISEYGIFRGEKWICGKTEQEMYVKLRMKWIPPELREDRGEIEASLNNALPELIKPSDIQGDLHVHSKWSDGRNSIEEIANAAKKFGYKYIAICDHSQAVKVANGLTIDRIKKQMDEIDKLNKKLKGITILKGSEVDIKPNGELDYPESILKKLDIVVAAIHSGFKESKEQITNRILQAIENPYVDIIAHPTGRVINQRDPYAVDLELVIEKAAEYNKVLEINSYYDRLDLNDVNARNAAMKGVMLSINTDAHKISELNMIRFGIAVARRGWLTKKNVLNTFSLQQLKKFLDRKNRK